MTTICKKIPPKNLIGIRHGQALHNVVQPIYGDEAYEHFVDTTLTAKGMQQALNAEKPKVDVVLVSPLMRALQTANIMYPQTPTIALECLKEYPQEIEICNKRSSLSLLKKLFPKVNFNYILDEEQLWPNTSTTPEQNVSTFNNFVSSLDQEHIAVVTHSTWLIYYMTRQIKAEPELNHCFPYKLALM